MEFEERIKFLNNLCNIKKHLIDEKGDKSNYHIDCALVILDGILKEYDIKR